MKINVNTKRKFDRAKTQLLYKSAFFNSLLLQSEHIWTDKVPTAATDGRRLYFNPEYIQTLTMPEVQGVFVHELCHKIFLHIIRARRYAKIKNGQVKDPADRAKLRRWNIACDYAINPIIEDEGFTLPTGALKEDKYKGMSAEKIYELLPEDAGEGDEGKDHFYMLGDGTEDDKELERQVKIETASAETNARGVGTLSAGIKKLLDDNAKTKVDWRAVLANFIEENILGDDDITFKRPNRRMLVHDMYLPSTEGIKVPPISIMFDTSGSIYAYPETTAQFIAEIKSLVDHTTPEAVHLICNDTRIQSHDIYEQGEDFTIELTGGGGTCFNAAFKYIQELAEYEPKANIVFTDLEFDYTSLEPSVPTLWVTYGRPHNYSPPFGQVVHIES